MTFRRLIISLGMVTAAIVMVGCSSGTGGQAAPITGSPTASSSTPPSAPKVTQPLNASTLVAKPCSSLTPGNVTSIGFTNPISKPDSDANGSGCVWSGEAGGNIGVSWDTANTHGLSDLYAKQSTYAYWQPTTVASYPAVYGDALGDQRATGDCVLNVGVSDQLAFFVEYDNPANAAQACSLAGKAASDVVANLKGGA
jgi:hypothetical protein